MKAFGQIGGGIFPIPEVITGEVERQFGVEMVGLAEEIQVKYYAISVERRLTHPAVVAISQAAKQFVFGAAKPTAERSAGLPT